MVFHGFPSPASPFVFPAAPAAVATGALRLSLPLPLQDCWVVGTKKVMFNIKKLG
jgi:hypothetical protein